MAPDIIGARKDAGAIDGPAGQEADGVLALLTDEQVMLQDMARDLGRKLGLANPADLEGADLGACWQELARAAARFPDPG